jgi:tRNA(Ile)-lysidine synthase
VARGESLEAVAREARYQLFAGALAPAEVLLTAHHAEDQLETLLLQLVRGAGVAGLAAMPRRTRCGRGEHLRPLLDFDRDSLQRYVAKSGLKWIEDPSNRDQRFDRNFVRHEVLPILRQRWPALAANVVRSADHLAGAHCILDELARADHFAAAEGTRLSVPMLRRLEPERMQNLLRYWIRLRNAPLPSSAILGEIVGQMLALTADTTPEVRWSGHVARRYRDRLYLSVGLPDTPRETAWWDWTAEPEFLLPTGYGRLQARTGTHASAALTAIPDKLRVGWRSGGETLRVAMNRPHRELRNLMQERGIVPWMRGGIPLLFAADALVAVGDLWIAAEFRAAREEPGILLEWLDHPELY